MKKSLLMLLVLLFVVPTFAQKKAIEDVKYRRSSLHLILVTTDDPILKEAEVMKSWKNYPFPDKYDQHSVDLITFPAGKPGVSFFEFATNYANGTKKFPTTIAELQKMKKEGDENKGYTDALKLKIEAKIKEEKLAHKLLEKWFMIQPDGSCNMSLIQDRGRYNATELEALDADKTTRGAAILADAGEELISNTFVQFCKLDFYDNEPIAKFFLMLTTAIANFAPGGDAAIAAAKVAYDLAKNGYSARTQALLYQINWNDSIQAEFYQCWINDKTIDYEKFQALPFDMKYIGSEISTSTAADPFADLKKAFGADKKVMSEEKLIDLTVVRNIDKLFTKMQKKYEVFRPKFPVLTNPPLTAQIGLKEGLKGGEQFELLETSWNDKLGKRQYVRKGIVKVDKKQIWDNRYNAGEAPENLKIDKKTGEPIMSTLLSKSKAAYPGMLLRQIK
jgi:hypothetical protein